MPSRQDQLHSYQYSQQRVVAALVTHDPDPHRSPLRRAGSAALVSLVVAALAVGAAAVYGLLKGSSTVDPRNEAVVFLELGSGARYVYLKSNDRMHPVLNYSSALLIANAAAPKTVDATAESLARVPLGDPLGIPGAPDSLPVAPDGLVEQVWTVCSQTPQNAAPAASPQSLLSIGYQPTDGTVLPAPRADTPAADLRGLLVSDPSARTFLVFNNRRFLIPADRLQQTRTWFGWTTQPLPVAAAWTNAVPLGPDLKPPAIPGLGAPSPVISGFEIGQLLRIRSDANSADKWGVVLGDGVADLTDVQARLMRADPQAYELREMNLNRYGNLPHSKTLLVAAADSAGLPPAVPVLLNGPKQVCLTYDGRHDGVVSIRIGPTTPAGTPVTGAPAVPGGVQADLVHVPRGKGALVVSAASPTAPAGSGTVSIVTDAGWRYPVASRDVLPRLGYGDVQPAPIPGQLVALLPQGPALDPVRARQSNTATGE